MAKKKDLLTDKDMENVSANITIRVSGEVLDAYRKWADKLGIGYQTLMKIKLAQALMEEDLEQRVSKIERKLG